MGLKKKKRFQTWNHGPVIYFFVEENDIYVRSSEFKHAFEK